MNWIQINNRIFELEAEGDLRDWKEWNKLIDLASKTAGCVKRKKHEERKSEATGEEKIEEGTHSENAVSLHGCLA